MLLRHKIGEADSITLNHAFAVDVAKINRFVAFINVVMLGARSQIYCDLVLLDEALIVGYLLCEHIWVRLFLICIDIECLL